MAEIIYTPKKKTTTLFIGSDGLEYQRCKKHPEEYFLRTEECAICAADKILLQLQLDYHRAEKLKKRQEKAEQKLKQKERRLEFVRMQREVQFTFLWNHYQTLIETIRLFLNVGYPTEVIMKIFIGERNAPYDLSHGSRFHINIQAFGKVLEHVNGRDCIGYYCVYAILIGDIKNPKELEEFYLQYCGQIKTDADFNTKVIKPYQNEDGAIDPEVYIEVLEKERNVNLSDEDKDYFKSMFLYSKYGTVRKSDVINIIKDGKEVKN